MFRGLILITLLGSAHAADSRFEGTWQGRMNELPAFDLRLSVIDGQVSGFIDFYFQLRGSSGKWEVKSKYECALLSPRVEGNVLTFEVVHHVSHGSSKRGPNVKFSMELTGDGEARFRKLEGEGQNGDGLRIVRLSLKK